MKDLHERLLKENKVYRAWHKVPYITALHFLMLLGFASLIGGQAQNVALAAANQTSVVSASSTDTQRLPQLTAQILAETKRYAAAKDADAKTLAVQNIYPLVFERKTLLLAAAQSNPHFFLQMELPKDIRGKLPSEVQSQLEQNVDVEGTLTVLHSDNFQDPSKSEYQYYVMTSQGGNWLRLYFDGDPPNALTGSKIRVHGTKLDNTLVVLGASAGNVGGTTVVTSAAVSTTAVHKVIVMLVNFSDNPIQPFSTTTADSFMFTASTSTASYYLENSYGQIQFSGDTVGWYTINYPAPTSSSQCSVTTWSYAADNIATKAGINLANYQHRVYIFPRLPCSTQGTVGGAPGSVWDFTFNLGYDPGDINHELGHNLGLHHAAAIDCGTVQMAPYSSCAYLEYGDVTDQMGGSYSGINQQFNALHKAALNWIDSASVQQVIANGTYVIAPLEQNSGVRALKINKPDSSDSYYLSYRQPIGYDELLPSYFSPNLTNGTSLHVWSGVPSVQTKFVAETPGDSTVTNDTILDGQTFSDTINGITISQLSHSASSSVVSVQFTGPVCQLQAPTLTISPLSQSGAAGAARSYSLSLSDADTSTCPSATFALSGVIPSGWSGSISPASLTLTPGGNGSATLSVTPALGTPDTTYSVGAQTNDGSVAVHQVSAFASYVSFSPAPDTTPPQVAITSPANGFKIKGNGNVTVSANASDAGGISSIAISIDGTVRQICSSATTCSYQWQGKSITAGTHSLSAAATDKSGNQSIASITVSK